MDEIGAAKGQVAKGQIPSGEYETAGGPVGISKADIDMLQNWFSYHAPNDEQQAAYMRIRASALALAVVIWGSCPPSADRTAAIRLLRESVMTANASIACGGK